MNISGIIILCFLYVIVLLTAIYEVHTTTYKTAYKKGFHDGYRFGKVDGKAESEDKE